VENQDIAGELLSWEDFPHLFRPLPDDTYKTQRGHLAVFAGSTGTTGAAWLCASAGARSRTGLVTLFVDPPLYEPFVAKLNSVMVCPGTEMFEPNRYSCLLVGPGWGLSEQRRELLEKLLHNPKPGVLDADGITLLAEILKTKTFAFPTEWVLTPHPGEFARLAGSSVADILSDPLPPLLLMSATLKAVIVLKGHCTTIASPRGRYWILDGMNAALATGGSGDLLSGMIAGLVASGYSAEEGARLGVLVHHRIGRRAFEERGLYLAEDLLPYISAEFKGSQR
jgi:NAD(P)H-hydrate epimerase